jgi:hypothetical protein
LSGAVHEIEIDVVVLELITISVGANGLTAGTTLRLVDAKPVPSPLIAETLTRYVAPRVKPAISADLAVETSSVRVVQVDPPLEEYSIT